MRFAYYSCEGESLAWQARLVDEGHEVLVYIDKAEGKFAQRVGDGIVPKTENLTQWLAFGAAPNTISFFDFSGSGELADRLRRSGRLVIGAGSFCDRLEGDRPFGEALAEKCGMKAPPSYRFSTISAAAAFLKRDPKQKMGDGGWAWKPNDDLGCDSTWLDDSAAEVHKWLTLVALPQYGDNHSCLLQERIKGVDLSTNRWWNGMSFVGPYTATIEEKKLMNDNIGASTGCSLNVVWYYPRTPRIAAEEHWDELAAEFRKRNAPPGIYDINAIVNRQGAFFLEWTPRLGYDSEFTSQRGITNLGGFLDALVHGRSVDEFFDANRIYVGVRVSVPPYPVGTKDIAEGSRRKYSQSLAVLEGPDGLWDKHFVATGLKRVSTGYQVAAESGYVGLVVAGGSSLKGCCDEVYAYLKDELVIPNLMYRTDAEKIIQGDLDKLGELGWETTPVLSGEE